MKVIIRDLGNSYQAYYDGNKENYSPFLYFMINTPGATKLKAPGWKLPKCYLPELEELYKNHIEHIANPWDNIGEDMKLPPFMYQKETIHFAINNPNSLLILPTGSGKTPIMIGIYLEAVKRGLTNKPGIICVKASLKHQWVNEIQKFSDLRAKVINTPSKAGKKFDQQFEDCDLFVLNYETLNNKDVVAKLREKEVECILADEIHYVNSHTAKRTKSFAKFSDLPIKIGATATPITNNPLNMFAIFNMIKPDLFGHYKRFANNYVIFDRFNRPRSVKNEASLNRQVKPYIFIKSEEEIADQLPSLVVSTRHIEITPKIREMNDRLKAELKSVQDELDELADSINDIKKLKENETYMALSARVMMYQTFMQELADDPRLLINSDSGSSAQYYVDERSPKLEALLELVEEITSSGDKVCIFTKYERMQRLLKEEIENAFDFKCAYVNGTMSSEERYRQAYDLFRDDNEYVCLIATNAMAEGVSLTECRYLIEYDLADSYAIQMQRHGRIKRANSIHRTGFVYQLILEESWDEIAQKIIEKKEKYDDTLVKSLSGGELD